MALLVPNVGEAEMLKRILGQTTTDVVVKLYSNSYVPLETSVVGDFTENAEAGYASATLTAASWTVAGDPTEASYAEQSFVFDAAASTANVEGYFITNVAGTIVLWAEKFSDGPYTIPTRGGTVFVIPKIQLA